MNILFLCVANSARSQMAEGLAKLLFSSAHGIYSAGSSPASQVNPFAVEVLREIGIDISTNRPKPISDLDLSTMGLVVTLCAEEFCPVLPAPIKHLHWPLPDPATLSHNPEKQLDAFRGVRDKLRWKIFRLKEDIDRGLLIDVIELALH